MTDINPEFDTPDGYTDDQLTDGNGWLPPDWDARCRAVRRRQDGRCARCGRRVDDGALTVEHVRRPPDGGDHRLENLVGRCGACTERDDYVTEKRVPSWASGRRGPSRANRPFSHAAFGAGLLVVGWVYVSSLHANAGPQAPDSVVAYVPWLVGEQVDTLLGAIKPLVDFVGLVLLIVFFAWLLGNY